jgi:hypothetical protein
MRGLQPEAGRGGTESAIVETVSAPPIIPRGFLQRMTPNLTQAWAFPPEAQSTSSLAA